MMTLPVQTKKNNKFKKTRSISSLYNFKKQVLNGNIFTLPFLFVIATLILLSGCSDSGSVGGGIGEPESNLVVDTLATTQFDTVALESYTGRKSFFSAGQFQDPLFGNVAAMAVLKPLLATKLDSVQFSDSTNMVLRMAINKRTVYGDSLSNSQFNFVEIVERWRAPAWRIRDDVELSDGPLVSSFSIATDDTVNIPLSNEWVQKYGEFYNRTDSTRRTDYNRDFFGFAMQAQNESKIITINPADSRFIVTNLDNSADTSQADSINVSFGDYAYSVYRSNVTESGSETTKIYNTLERVLTLDFDFSSDLIRPINIARAELVIYRDNLMLQESIEQAGPNAVRPNTSPIRLHFVEEGELPQSIDPGGQLAQQNPGIYDEDDQAYHFDITTLVAQGFFTQSESTRSIYLTQGSNDGVIRSNIIFNDEQTLRKAPKLIITSTNNR